MGAICGSLIATLMTVFLIFSGCSDNIHTPLSTDLPETETGLTGGGGDAYTGTGPWKDLDGLRDGRIVAARAGEMLSAADIRLEYDEEELPEGVELQAVFTDPGLFEFIIVPVGHARSIEIEVKIDLSKAELEAGDVEEGRLKVFGVSAREVVPIDAEVEFDEMEVEFDTTTDFARYALARD
jgi:hypothetical protein